MDKDKLLREINLATHYSKKHYNDRVESARAAEEDTHQSDRLKVRCQCKFCYYIRGPLVAGSAFTKWNCNGCGTQGNHSNTAVPKYCGPCSFAYRVCVSCGGDLHLSAKRRNLTYEN